MDADRLGGSAAVDAKEEQDERAGFPFTWQWTHAPYLPAWAVADAARSGPVPDRCYTEDGQEYVVTLRPYQASPAHGGE